MIRTFGLIKKIKFNNKGEIVWDKFNIINNNYDYKNWKKEKKLKGEWLGPYDYLKKKLKIDKIKSHSLIINDTKINIKKEIIIDTETTGLGYNDQICEISLIETIDGIITGRKFYSRFNPDVEISKKASEIHKMTKKNLEKEPKFKDKVEEIIKFIGNSDLIAHNANFDYRLLNQELTRCGWDIYPKNRFIDTLKIARFLFPGESNSQDSLCLRFGIDNNNRITTGIHNAYEDTIHLYHILNEFNIKLLEKGINKKYFFLSSEKLDPEKFLTFSDLEWLEEIENTLSSTHDPEKKLRYPKRRKKNKRSICLPEGHQEGDSKRRRKY